MTNLSTDKAHIFLIKIMPFKGLKEAETQERHFRSDLKLNLKFYRILKFVNFFYGFGRMDPQLILSDFTSLFFSSSLAALRSWIQPSYGSTSKRLKGHKNKLLPLNATHVLISIDVIIRPSPFWCNFFRFNSCPVILLLLQLWPLVKLFRFNSKACCW